MSCRMVVGRRPDGEIGIFISSAGQDARYESLSNLLFSSTRRHAMQVAVGTVGLQGAGQAVRVNFDRQLEGVPMVFCSGFNPRPNLSTVHAQPDQSGFYAWAASLPNGTAPAAHTTVAYYAFMKQVPA